MICRGSLILALMTSSAVSNTGDGGEGSRFKDPGLEPDVLGCFGGVGDTVLLMSSCN